MRSAIHKIIEFFYFDFLHFIPLQTFKYIACGSTTVLVDYIVYYISYYFLLNENTIQISQYTLSPHVASSILSFLASFPTGFLLNKYIAFNQSPLRGRVQLFRYAITVFSCFIFSIFFIKLFIDFFGFNPKISKVLTIIIVAVYSYFAQQYFSFKVKGNHLEVDEMEK